MRLHYLMDAVRLYVLKKLNKKEVIYKIALKHFDNVFLPKLFRYGKESGLIYGIYEGMSKAPKRCQNMRFIDDSHNTILGHSCGDYHDIYKYWVYCIIEKRYSYTKTRYQASQKKYKDLITFKDLISECEMEFISSILGYNKVRQFYYMVMNYSRIIK